MSFTKSYASASLINRVVHFDTKIIDQVRYYYETLPIVSSGINFFLSQVLEGGIDIVGKTKSGIYEINIENPTVTFYIKNELLPAIEKILLELILYGFSAIRVAESKKLPGWPTIVVIPHKFYTPAMVWNEHYQKEYIAIDKLGYSNAGVQKIDGSEMLVLYEPFDEGRISSPLSLCIENMAVMSKLTEYYMRASYFNSRPPFVFSKHDTPTAGLNRGGPESASSSAALVGGASVAYLGISQAFQNVNDAEQRERVRELEVAQREMEKRNEEFQNKKMRESTSTKIPPPPPVISFIESELPITHSFTAPTGQKLERSTPFMSPDDLINLRNSLQSEVYRAIGVPPVMIKDTPDHASSVTFALTQMRQSIQHFQSKNNRILQTCLHLVLAADLAEISESSSESYLFQINKDLASSSSNISDGEGNDEDVNEGEPKKKERKNEFLDNLYPEGKNSELEGMSYDERLQQFITADDSVNIEVEFVYNPTMTFEMMLQYYHNGIIHFEAFQDLALATGGLPISAKNIDVVPPPLFENSQPIKSNIEDKIVKDEIGNDEKTNKRNRPNSPKIDKQKKQRTLKK